GGEGSIWPLVFLKMPPKNGFPGMKRFQPESKQGYSINVSPNRQQQQRNRRAPLSAVDPDGWIDTNQVRQRGGTASSGIEGSRSAANQQEGNERIVNGLVRTVAAENNLNVVGSFRQADCELPPGGIPQLPFPNAGYLRGHNWTLTRLFSEELYAVFEKNNEIFEGMYLSKWILAELFFEKTMKGEYSRDVFSLGVQITTIYDLFRFGQTGVRLTMKGLVFPKSGESSPLDEIKLTANYELADLLKMVIVPGDFLIIFGENHLRYSSTIHLNISVTGKIFINHFKYTPVFSPTSGDGILDVYNQIDDPRFNVVTRKSSDTEYQIMVKRAVLTSVPQRASELVIVNEESFRGSSQSPGPSSSQTKSVEMVNIEKEKKSQCENQRNFQPRVIKKSAEPNSNNVLSAEIFDQSFTPSSGQSNETPKTNSTPDTCDSTDYVMQVILTNDNDSPASQVKSKHGLSASQVLDDSVNSVPIEVHDSVPKNRPEPFLEQQQDVGFNNVLADLEDSHELISPRKEFDSDENIEDHCEVTPIVGVSAPRLESAEELQNYHDAANAEDIDSNSAPGLEATLRSQINSVYADLEKDTQEDLPSEGLKIRGAMPRTEKTPEAYDSGTNEVSIDDLPLPIYTHGADTQYFDEEGNPSLPGPSTPHPSEDQPAAVASPAKYKRKKKNKARKKKLKPVICKRT
ncbi:unnamed protein product, partial [Allacma fusca]